MGPGSNWQTPFDDTYQSLISTVTSPPPFSLYYNYNYYYYYCDLDLYLRFNITIEIKVQQSGDWPILWTHSQ